MNLLCTVAATMVGLAVVFRLLWWAFGRPHQLATQGQGATENPTELSKAGHGIEANDKAPGEVDTQGRKI